jgi:hypothetical protein
MRLIFYLNLHKREYRSKKKNISITQRLAASIIIKKKKFKMVYEKIPYKNIIFVNKNL